MKRRPINKDKYGISKHRYLEVIHHCLQYPEWREELENMTDTVKAIQYGQEGKGSPSQASATERLAIKRAELLEKCERIEQTAIEADADIYQWLLEGVTTDYATYISKYNELSQSFEKWNSSDMNDAEKAYYIEVQTRVNNKLLEAAQ